MDLEDTNPLRDKVKPRHISPMIGRRFPEKKPDFKFALRRCLLNELGLKIPKSDEEILNDPYLILGYGINAYHDILNSLAQMFIWISIFTIPILIIYSSGRHYDDQKSYIVSQFIIGNFGSSSVFCQQFRMSKKVATMSCPTNT